jgi:hypothetical protein
MARGWFRCESVCMSESDKDKTPKASGKVRHDSGGRAVWQWAIDSGRHAIESTSLLLKKLDLSHLRLLEDDEREAAKRAAEEQASGAKSDQPIPTFGGPAESDAAAEARRTFDPYNSRTPVGRGLPPAKPKEPPKPRVTQPVVPAKKPGLLGKLFGKD